MHQCPLATAKTMFWAPPLHSIRHTVNAESSLETECSVDIVDLVHAEGSEETERFVDIVYTRSERAKRAHSLLAYR